MPAGPDPVRGGGRRRRGRAPSSAPRTGARHRRVSRPDVPVVCGTRCTAQRAGPLPDEPTTALGTTGMFHVKHGAGSRRTAARRRAAASPRCGHAVGSAHSASRHALQKALRHCRDVSRETSHIHQPPEGGLRPRRTPLTHGDAAPTLPVTGSANPSARRRARSQRLTPSRVRPHAPGRRFSRAPSRARRVSARREGPRPTPRREHPKPARRGVASRLRRSQRLHRLP